MRWTVLFGAGVLFMAASGTPAAAAGVGLDRELAAIVNDPAHPLASLAVLAVRNGRVVYRRGFGFRSINAQDPSRSRPAGPDTLYRIASISKLVTTLGVMKLLEAGKLDLDRDVSDYLGYPLRNPHFPDVAITLRMLLTHTSSLRDDAGYYWEARLGVDLRDVLVPGGALHGAGAMWASNVPPGAYFQYANLPWGVIGTIMERASGERFDRLMQRLVLVPLQLRGGFHPPDFAAADLAHVATLYRKRSDIGGKEVWDPNGPWVAQVDDYRLEAPVPRALPGYVIGSNGTLFGPQGNCRLSADGLGTIMLMLLNEGRHRGKAFLKPATVELMLAAHWRHDGSGNNGNNSSSSHKGLMNAWGLGNQHFLDRGGDGTGDRLVEGDGRDDGVGRSRRVVHDTAAAAGFTAKGHLGDAWGLTSAMVFDMRTRNGMIYLIGGPGFDPDTNPGTYSSLYRHEQKILSALYNGALRGRR